MAVKNQVPTNRLERELRKLYLVWLGGMPEGASEAQLTAYINKFGKDAEALIARLGGQAASLGALAGFPVPKLLELSPAFHDTIDQMHQAATRAGIAAGLNAKDVARQMLNAGFDQSYRRLERIARTETVSAHWSNAWDSVAEFDELVMLWGAEISEKTCDYCIERDGLVVEDDSIRDHPSGRCTLIPTLRSKVDYKGTLLADGSITQDPDWTSKRRVTKDPQAGERGQSISSVDDIEGT